MHETEDPEVAAAGSWKRKRLRPGGIRADAPARGVLLDAVGDQQVHARVPGLPGRVVRPARLDAEIEKYFDISMVLPPVQETLDGSGTISTSMEPSAS
jgi:hypothetical protein